MSPLCRLRMWLRSLAFLPVCKEDVPRWVFRRLPDNMYDRRVYLKGRHYLWRVDGVMQGQGMVQYHFARKLRRRL